MKTRCDRLILDGRHLLWRSSDAYSNLSVEVDGEEVGTGGVYGFLTMASRVHAKYRGKMEVAWEGTTNFRHRLFPGYKERPEPDADQKQLFEDMGNQEAMLIEILSALGVDQFRGVDHEADDAIGTRALRGAREGKRVIIYSGDSDLRQLVQENIVVAAPVTQGKNRGKDQVYADDASVEERHGVPPRLLAQLKALAGDSSDKIPGAPGIGPKTAQKILNHYGSLADSLKGALKNDPEWPSTPRHKAIIVEHVRSILLYQKLTKIQTDAPTEAIPAEVSQAKVLKLFKRYKFRSLMAPAELNGLMRMGAG